MTRAVRAGHAPPLACAEEAVASIRRVTYVRPLYRAVAQQPATRPRVQELFARYAPRYHPIAREEARHHDAGRSPAKRVLP